MSRDDLELGGRVAGALAGENHRGHAVAMKVIARRALAAERGGRTPRPKRRRKTRTILTAVGLVVGLAGCAWVPAGLRDVVNTNAVVNARQHMADHDPAAEVLCADPAAGWAYLIPSYLVDRYGNCADTIRAATATSCEVTEGGDVECRVLSDAGSAPVFAAAKTPLLDRAKGS